MAHWKTVACPLTHLACQYYCAARARTQRRTICVPLHTHARTQHVILLHDLRKTVQIVGGREIMAARCPKGLKRRRTSYLNGSQSNTSQVVFAAARGLTRSVHNKVTIAWMVFLLDFRHPRKTWCALFWLAPQRKLVHCAFCLQPLYRYCTRYAVI